MDQAGGDEVYRLGSTALQADGYVSDVDVGGPDSDRLGAFALGRDAHTGADVIAIEAHRQEFAGGPARTTDVNSSIAFADRHSFSTG